MSDVQDDVDQVGLCEAAFNWGEAHATRAIADQLAALAPSQIRLACGEMTAGEMRTVLTVLAWRVLKGE